MDNENERLENQTKIINFIKDTLTKEENEKFYVLEVNMYSPFYTFLGDNFYTGNLIIFCNEAYLNIIKYAMSVSIYSPWVSRQNPSKLCYQGFAKAFKINEFDKEQESEVKSIVLRQKAFGTKYRSITNLKEKYSYIIESINYINKVNNEICIDDLINTLSSNIVADRQNFFIDLGKKSYTLKK